MPRRSKVVDSSSVGRARTSLACNQCRKRKSKCGGEQPRCLMCETAGRDCTYDQNARKRGLQSGYVRSLEIVLGLIFHHLPQSDSRVHSILRTQSPKDLFLADDKGESFAARWRRSDVARDLGQFLQPISRRSSEGGEQHTQRSSPSVLDIMDMETSSPADNGDVEVSQTRSTSTCRANNQSTQTFSTTARFTADILSINLPPQTIDLVDLYLAHTQPWFPIIERSDLLRSIHTNVSVDARNNKHDAGMRLCLWAIIAFVTSNRSFTDTDLCPEDIQKCVRAAILEEDQSFELGHILALMILVVMKIALGQLDLAWILSAQASRMAMVYMKRKSIDRLRFNRIIRGSIIVDVLLSSTLAQTTCWSDEALNSFDSSTDEGSIEEWQTWRLDTQSGAAAPLERRQPLRALSIFKYTTDLIQRLNKFFVNTKSNDGGMEFLREHQIWKERLPRFCQLPSDMLCSPPLLILHLTWHSSVCLLAGRPTSIPTQVIQRIIESIDAALRMITIFCDMAQSAAYPPLLICYITQVLRSIQSLNLANDLRLEQDETCQRVLERLQSVWQANIPAHSDTIEHNTPRAHISTPLDFVDNGTFARGQRPVHVSGQETTDEMIDPTLAFTQVDNSTHEQLEATNPSLQGGIGNAEDEMDTMNDFDAYLFEMSLVPPTRDSEQARLLSQNLGFLDDTFINDYPDIF